jgi:transcriptional regulator with XRE-family HTH domain
MDEFDLPGWIRRIRRRADMSQRQLAQACGVSQASVAQAETGRREFPVGALARAAQLAGLRLALLDAEGNEVAGMAGDAVRDLAGRRFPAHLDTRHGDEDWWHGISRYSRAQPWYTFDRVRYTRDYWRGRLGTPEDHQLPRPEDSPEERSAARRREVECRARESWERRRAAGEVPDAPTFACTCPAECDRLDDWSGTPVHAEDCPCSCDVG